MSIRILIEWHINEVTLLDQFYPLESQIYQYLHIEPITLLFYVLIILEAEYITYSFNINHFRVV